MTGKATAGCQSSTINDADQCSDRRMFLCDAIGLLSPDDSLARSVSSPVSLEKVFLPTAAHFRAERSLPARAKFFRAQAQGAAASIEALGERGKNIERPPHDEGATVRPIA
jgi:hypothetical protein